MSRYNFSEGILHEYRMKKSFIVPVILVTIILIIAAAAVWLIPLITAVFPNGMRLLVPISAWLSTSAAKPIVLCIVFGLSAVIVLVSGIVTLAKSRFVITKSRICSMLGTKRYREVRADKIDSIIIRGKHIKIYAGGRKVISFGPIKNIYNARDDAACLIESASDSSENAGYDKEFGKAVPLTQDKDADVFDGDVL